MVKTIIGRMISHQRDEGGAPSSGLHAPTSCPRLNGGSMQPSRRGCCGSEGLSPRSPGCAPDTPPESGDRQAIDLSSQAHERGRSCILEHRHMKYIMDLGQGRRQG